MKGNFFKTSDGKNIYYEESGQGRPLLFIPGFLCTTKYFHRNVETLSKYHRVITLDQRGYGNSTKSAGNMNLPRMARDIKELIDHLDLHDITMIGWSMGGNIAMVYYSRFGPYRLKQLGLLDSTLFPYGEGSHNAHNLAGYNLERFSDQMKSAFRDYEGYCTNFAASLFKNSISEEDQEWIVSEALKCPPHLAMELYEDFIHTNCEEVLPTITIPTLLCAANSPRTPKGMEMARYYRSLMQCDVTYQEFPNGGHIFFYECPEEFNQVLLTFMDKNEVTP